MRPTNIPVQMYRWAATGRDNTVQTLPAGEILSFIAASALAVGEYVYISAANTVAKSAVAATVAAAPIGVVVAGSAMSGGDFQIPEDLDTRLAALGAPSAAPYPATTAAGQEVWVLFSGLALVYSTGAVAVAGTVIPGATAGQVVAGVTAGQILGYNVGPATAGAGWVLIKIEHR